VLGTIGAQKSPPGLRRAGFQDFVSGSGDHQQRILVGWRELNPRPKFLQSFPMQAKSSLCINYHDVK